MGHEAEWLQAEDGVGKDAGDRADPLDRLILRAVRIAVLVWLVGVAVGAGAMIFAAGVVLGRWWEANNGV